MQHSVWLWAGFIAFVLVMLALDMGVFHRKDHRVSVKEGALWSAVWIAFGLGFGGILFLWQGSEKGLEYLTGYVIEKTLSVDNIFVFVILFQYFRVPDEHQYRVLFWGVLGAIVMRAILIVLGTTLVSKFEWIMYVFGVFLVYTAIRLAIRKSDAKVEPEKNPVVKLFRRAIPVTSDYEGKRFFVHKNGRLHATPLMVALIVVETTDLVFAVDSIPAILAVTQDPFIVFSSNVFAILGLRALYFVLKDAVERFHFLKYGLSLVLGFVGAKMLLKDVYEIHTEVSLSVIAGVIAISIAASLWMPKGGRGRPLQRASPNAAPASAAPPRE